MSKVRLILGPVGIGNEGIPIVPHITILALTFKFSITASNCIPPTLSKKQSIQLGAIFFKLSDKLFTCR